MFKKTTLALGIVIAIIGILGFISNPVIGPGSYFEANIPHSILHLVIGLVFIYVALMQSKFVKKTLTVVGVIVVIVAVLGFLSNTGGTVIGKIFQLFTVNNPVNWLHLVLGVAAIAFGWNSCKCTGDKCTCGADVPKNN